MQLIESINQFDARMLLACVGTRHQQQLSRIAYSVSKTGDGYAQIAVPVSLYLLGANYGKEFLLATLMAFAIWLPIYWVLKNTCRRRRPPAAIPSFNASIIASDKFSFPSGHTAAAFLLATLAVLFFGAVAAPLYLWALAVGASRVLLGVHFPTDILAGASLGTGIAHLAYDLLMVA
ncbi:phosphatase PAP2 family protein [Spongiibacter sp. KMU-158]|uniref:undecaprenyl-diphosphate phosphatase n=1 Tax=Spongiibacter pelagi TaxID=2760804 RepID=A0A927C223_9GAMM|nr:phosphatase PAP2 family protein [Spongiibacter pelagi]MBD2858366.1 phosphatase PAP2 family protein [Spongiibacter pelagi]